MHSSISKGDRVRFIRADGKLSDEVVEVHDVFGGKDTPANFSYIQRGSGEEQLYHSDLVHLDGDESPITVPAPETWYIAIGNAGGWGRARYESMAVANMKRQGGKPDAWRVYRVNQWTQVNGMGGLRWPSERGDPVEVSCVESKKAKRA